MRLNNRGRTTTLTSSNTPSQLPTESIYPRQLPALLWGGGAELGGAGAPAEVQRGFGAGVGRGGDDGVVGRRRAACRRGTSRRQVQGAALTAYGRAEGQLSGMDGGRRARGDGDGRRGGELARKPRGFVVQVFSTPGALVGGEEKLEGPEPST